MPKTNITQLIDKGIDVCDRIERYIRDSRHRPASEFVLKSLARDVVEYEKSVVEAKEDYDVGQGTTFDTVENMMKCLKEEPQGVLEFLDGYNASLYQFEREQEREYEKVN